MGLLALGTPLPWAEAKQHADYVRDHGIDQFLKIWHRLKDRTGDVLLWGDEVGRFPALQARWQLTSVFALIFPAALSPFRRSNT